MRDKDTFGISINSHSSDLIHQYFGGGVHTRARTTHIELSERKNKDH